MSVVLRTMRLRFVGVKDFRKSEATMFFETIKEHHLRLNETDVVCFRSGVGDQVVFVYCPNKVNEKQTVLASSRLRITWGTWSPIMIADYAQMVGIKLNNLPTLDVLVRRLKSQVDTSR